MTDDGPGIPAEDTERAFGRFSRLDDARSRDGEEARTELGSGLGLAIVRATAEAHGGSVTLRGRRARPARHRPAAAGRLMVEPGDGGPRLLGVGRQPSAVGRHRRRRTGSWLELRLRAAGALLLAGSAGIHLDLYLTGYRSIPVIGWLFLVQLAWVSCWPSRSC